MTLITWQLCHQASTMNTVCSRLIGAYIHQVHGLHEDNTSAATETNTATELSEAMPQGHLRLAGEGVLHGRGAHEDGIRRRQRGKVHHRARLRQLRVRPPPRRVLLRAWCQRDRNILIIQKNV